MGYGDDLKDAVQDHVHGVASYTQPAAQYLALFSDVVTDAGVGTELSGNGYARQSITFGASSGGLSQNTNTVVFTASGGDWTSAISGAIYDAVTGGNFLETATITSATLLDTATLTYSAGDIDSTLS